MKSLSNDKGFSLVEVMVGVTLLTIGMLAISSMIMRSSENSRYSGQARAGDAIALELMEEIKKAAISRTFADLSNLQLSKLYPGSTSKYEYLDGALPTPLVLTTGLTQYFEHLGQGQGFIYKWRVEDQTGEKWPKGLLKVEVTVGWRNCDPMTPDPTKCTYKSTITSFILQATT